MIKIRLWGKEDEISQAISELEKCKGFDILAVSDPYRDRGESKLFRVYVEADTIKKKVK